MKKTRSKKSCDTVPLTTGAVIYVLQKSYLYNGNAKHHLQQLSLIGLCKKINFAKTHKGLKETVSQDGYYFEDMMACCCDVIYLLLKHKKNFELIFGSQAGKHVEKHQRMDIQKV